MSADRFVTTTSSCRPVDHRKGDAWLPSTTRSSSASRKDATKPQIKAAVESAVQGQGEGRQHLVAQGQDQALPRHIGTQSDVKKAVVTLAEGQSIDVTTGL